jgi:hypothetical protein
MEGQLGEWENVQEWKEAYGEEGCYVGWGFAE